MSTSLRRRLRTYAFASAVSAGGGASSRGRLAKYAQPPRAAMAIMMATTIGALIRDCPSLLATDRHLPDKQSRRCLRASEFEVRADHIDTHQHLLQTARD